MLKIRFNRTGKRNQASFRLVLQEHTIAPGGRHVEVLGSHNPHTKQTVLKTERIKHWIGAGAQLSDTVHNLLVKEGVVKGEKKAVKMERPKQEEVAESVETPAEEMKSEETPTEEKKEEAPVIAETETKEGE